MRFEGAALGQLQGMPSAAFDALVERVRILVDQPWDATVMRLAATRRIASPCSAPEMAC
jgi:hypothetical protein